MAETRELTVEEVSDLERLIQVGDPGEVLPNGQTVGDYREAVRARASDLGAAREAGREETESFRRQAQSMDSAARIVETDDGQLVAQPVPGARAEGSETDAAAESIEAPPPGGGVKADDYQADVSADTAETHAEAPADPRNKRRAAIKPAEPPAE